MASRETNPFYILCQCVLKIAAMVAASLRLKSLCLIPHCGSTNPDNSYVVCHHIGSYTSHFADILKKAGKATAFTLGTPRGLWVKVKTSGRVRREVKTEVTDED